MIAALLPPPVVTVEAFTDVPGEPPFPGEEAYVAAAVESRRREFVTARRCARQALAALGHPPAPIHRTRRGAPQWPAGVTGSITHCAGYRAAAVAPADRLASIGIDAEPAEPLPPDVLPVITLGEERGMLTRLAVTDPAAPWDRLLFSAKEALFKAWYPLTGRELDFTEALLRIDPSAGTFTARILIDGGRTDGGPPLTELTGRWTITGGVIATALVVPE